MRPEVATDLFDAERAFIGVAWPAIAPLGPWESL